jgi:hypothetical protein
MLATIVEATLKAAIKAAPTFGIASFGASTADAEFPVMELIISPRLSTKESLTVPRVPDIVVLRDDICLEKADSSPIDFLKLSYSFVELFIALVTLANTFTPTKALSLLSICSTFLKSPVAAVAVCAKGLVSAFPFI